MSDGVMNGVKVVLFDVDDTLYKASCGLTAALESNIERYLVEELHVPAGEAAAARANYSRHGTALAGLIAESPAAFDVDAYIASVYESVDYSAYLSPDARVAQVLADVARTRRVWAFSNAHREHVLAVLAALGVSPRAFEGIVEARGLGFVLKPRREAFDAALRAVGGVQPREMLLIDGDFASVEAARDYGMQAVHVSNAEDCASMGCAEHQLRTASPRNSKRAQSCMVSALELDVCYPDLVRQ